MVMVGVWGEVWKAAGDTLEYHKVRTVVLFIISFILCQIFQVDKLMQG